MGALEEGASTLVMGVGMIWNDVGMMSWNNRGMKQLLKVLKFQYFNNKDKNERKH